MAALVVLPPDRGPEPRLPGRRRAGLVRRLESESKESHEGALVLACGLAGATAARDRTVADDLRAIVDSTRSDIDRGSAAVCLGRVGDDRDIGLRLSVLADERTSAQLKACLVHGLGRLLDRTGSAALARIAADGRWWNQFVRDPILGVQFLVD